MAKQKVNAAAVAADVRSGMSNAAIMEKYGLSTRGLEYLFRKMIENQMVTAAEISEAGKARSRSIQPGSQEAPAGVSQDADEPLIESELADAVVEEVRKGTHDYDIMIRLRMGREDLQVLIENLVRLGRLSVEEVEARKPRKSEQCPHCHRQVYQDSGQCPHCGKDLVQSKSSAAGVRPGVKGQETASEDASSDKARAWDAYWDNRGALGMFGAFFSSLSQCLRSPSNFFSNLPVDLGYWAPGFFGAICIAAPTTFYLLLLEFVTGHSAVRGVEWLIFLPICVFFALIFAAIILPISSLIIHVFVMLFMRTHRGFQATFRVVSYSSSTSLLCVFPVIGNLVGSLWSLYLSGVGLQKTHNTSAKKAFAAVLAPFCVAVTVAVISGPWPIHRTDSKAAFPGARQAISTTHTDNKPSSYVSTLPATLYQIGGKKFSIITPAPLKETKLTVATGLGKVDVLLLTAKQGNIECGVMCVPEMAPSYLRFLRYLPPLPFFPGRDPEATLDQYRDNMVKNFDGKMISETKVMLGSNPGREVVIEAAEKFGRNTVVKGRAFVVEDRLYQIMVSAPNEELNTPEVNVFFDSFKFVSE
jgi:hypothetical protein